MVHKGQADGIDVLFNIIETNKDMDQLVKDKKAKTEKTMIHAELIIDGQIV